MHSHSISLYIHIPFCKSKCRYCDFYSIKYDNELADRYIDAFVNEWEQIISELNHPTPLITTIFCGGGTPSILTLKQWEKIGRFINRLNLSNNLEWSVECNPESFSIDLADLLFQLGVTRLTFGVQSLSAHELSITGRVHTAERAQEVLSYPVLGNFKSIGADIMYGLPGQTVDTFTQTIQKTISTPYVKHCSVYELTICEGTPFGRHQKILPLPDDEAISDMSRTAEQILQSHGFEHYEISNFAKNGFRCLHNQVYWDHKNYIGLGPASHSFYHPYRWGNIADIFKYIEGISNKNSIKEIRETIDSQILTNEMLFLGFRRIDGINEDTFKEKTGIPFAERVNLGVLNSFISRGWLRYEKPWYRVTKEGLYFADKMARDLM